mmetsp:Transcript_91919/g.255931  ORF Transcript_91919/g.255931 Transcript_91919/m.255931 type:complete len:91 (+) Transcript_91919:106-378(+)
MGLVVRSNLGGAAFYDFLMGPARWTSLPFCLSASSLPLKAIAASFAHPMIRNWARGSGLEERNPNLAVDVMQNRMATEPRSTGRDDMMRS